MKTLFATLQPVIRSRDPNPSMTKSSNVSSVRLNALNPVHTSFHAFRWRKDHPPTAESVENQKESQALPIEVGAGKNSQPRSSPFSSPSRRDIPTSKNAGRFLASMHPPSRESQALRMELVFAKEFPASTFANRLRLWSQTTKREEEFPASIHGESQALRIELPARK
ncbi:hypothetical protein FRC20_007990 [Serendipita sp. 405]|nr:hypothetical protein FRC20_007990 [Serendipita sp. 405]